MDKAEKACFVCKKKISSGFVIEGSKAKVCIECYRDRERILSDDDVDKYASQIVVSAFDKLQKEKTSELDVALQEN